MNTLFDLDNPPQKSIRQIVAEIKENNQDFEFYPTTEDMLKVVAEHIRRGDILDIGAGNGGLKRYLDKIGKLYKDYFAIEKSEILLNQLPEDVYVLGTDFNNCTLIDKPADVIFCNPPYSEFKNWTLRILKEGNFKDAFLIIPERWKDYPEIKKIIEERNITTQVLAKKDFLNAERQARAKVDIIRFTKYKEDNPFDNWFKDTFDFEEVNDHHFECCDNQKKIKNELVGAPNKIEYLVNLYNDEMNRLYGSFKAICQLDVETLHDLGIETSKVKESLKYKINNTKILYWRLIFDHLDDITKRLTHKTRDELFDRFDRLKVVDFNASNIRAVVIWVLKNASSMFDKQLIDFYKEFTLPDNVIKYKSNQRVFKRDEWYNTRFDRDEKDQISHYCLSYRLIADYLFNTSSKWNDKDQLDGAYDYKRNRVLEDFSAISHNLGFEIGHYTSPRFFGEKYYIYDKSGTPLIEYKIYKNGNTHLKLNIELAKALNVEVARLLGWIRDKSDVANEFPKEFKDAAKYYGASFILSLENPNIKLLTTN